MQPLCTNLLRILAALLTLCVSPMTSSAERLLAPGEVATWGGLECGELTIPLGLTGVKAIALGVRNNAVLLETGAALSWPTDQYGYGSWDNGWDVPPNNSNLVAVAAGDSFSIALRDDGTVVSWGSRTAGTPPVGLNSVSAIASLGDSCWGLKRDGSVIAWSSGAYFAVPANFTNIIAIAVGGDLLGLRFDGTVVANASTPPPWLAGVVALAAGSSHYLALREDGSVVAWGSNSGGESSVPVGLSDVVAVAGGAGYSLALKSDGHIVFFGNPGSFCDPFRLTNFLGVAAIAAKGSFAMAVGGYPPKAPPAMVSFAGDQTVGVGALALFSAAASGARPLGFQWRFNGTDLPAATNSTLILSNVQSAQAGLYSVIISNSFGSVISSNAALLVDSSPVQQATLFVTNLVDSSPGSLRQAILDANSRPGDDAIGFLTAGTIFLASALPAVTGNTAIIGPGTNLLSVSADYHRSRVFTFNSGTSNTISGLAIGNGWLTNRNNGAGILNSGALTLTRCALLNQTVYGGSGAAIYNTGSLRLKDCYLANNFIQSFSTSDSSANTGGAIYNSGTLSMDNSAFAGNFVFGSGGSPQLNTPGRTASGGAVYTIAGNLTVTNCTFANNQVYGGGGPQNPSGTTAASGGAGAGGAVSIEGGSASFVGSTLSGNYVHGGGGGGGSGSGTGGNGSTGSGGGIFISGGTLVLLNTTVSGNLAEGGGGGGRQSGGFGSDGRGGGVCVIGGTANFTNATITTNQVHGGSSGGPPGDTGHGYGGGIFRSSGTADLRNVLIAANGPDYYYRPIDGPDVYGSFASQGNNLIANSYLGSGFVASDLLNTNANVGPLQNNGGLTMTHALLPGSPAIDAGTSSGAPSVDQRGVPRPQRFAVDIGAFEAMPDPLAIAAMVPSKAVFRGTNVTLWVDASGNPPFAYQWRLNGTNIAGATNVTYPIPSVHLADGGNYSVIVSDLFGSVTGAMTLTVFSAPYIVAQPQDQTAIVTMDIPFNVLAEGTSPLAYRWRFKGFDLAGRTNLTLTISNVQSSDAGAYTVVVANQFGSVTSVVAMLDVRDSVPVTVHVQGLGSVTRQPEKTGYSLGEQVTLNAMPDRWNTFSQWGDGVTNNPRFISVGLTNDFTAVFTPVTPLETVTIGGVSRTAPVGMPEILLDGQFVLTGTVSRVQSARVELQTSFSNGAIYYTLDGSQPSDPSSIYFAPFTIRRSVLIRAVAWNSQHTQSWEADPVQVIIIPAYGLTVVNAGGGTVGVSPTNAAYASNTLVSLTAIPVQGWTFLQWLGDVTGTNPVTSLRMTRAKTVEAVFATHFTTTVTGNGSLVIDPQTILYPYGTVIRLTAAPQFGNYFVSWANAATGTNNPLQFVVTAADTVVASLFAPLNVGQSALTVVPNGTGQVTVTPRASRYNSGDVLTLTAVPDLNQSFIGWSGDAAGQQNPLSVLLDQSKLITANFTKRPRLKAFGFDRPEAQSFQVLLIGQFDGRYLIEMSSDLSQWQPWRTVTNSLGTTQVTDDSATNMFLRFYRASEAP